MGTHRILGLLCTAAGAAALTALAANSATTNRRIYGATRTPPPGSTEVLPQPAPVAETHVEAARRFNHSSALLAFSVLTDSAMEHYRGSFDNPAMYTPLVSASLSLIAGLHGGADRRQQTHHVRHAIYRSAAAAGIAGTGFHFYNVMKRPGGWSWNNLFHAAPLGAPREPGAQPVAAPIGGQQPLPQGAVSMMSRQRGPQAGPAATQPP